MLRQITTVLIVNLFKLTVAKLEPYIIGGEEARITDFPHSVYLAIDLEYESPEYNRMIACGASLLNQEILLTAAHCLELCRATYISCHIFAAAGKEKKNYYSGSTVTHFLIYGGYNSGAVMANDIAILIVKYSFRLSSIVKRVAITTRDMKSGTGIVAGWGQTDIRNEENSDFLMYVTQRIWTREKCNKYLEIDLQNAFCAGEKYSTSYVTSGDSGSALVVNDFIQVGIVSFKYKRISQSLTVYTDVSAFVGWIRNNSKKMYCIRGKINRTRDKPPRIINLKNVLDTN